MTTIAPTTTIASSSFWVPERIEEADPLPNDSPAPMDKPCTAEWGVVRSGLGRRELIGDPRLRPLERR